MLSLDSAFLPLRAGGLPLASACGMIAAIE